MPESADAPRLAKPFDATTKRLLELDPVGWLNCIGLVDSLLKGVPRMKESVTYQAILREGHAEGILKGEQRILLQMARKRLGEPSPAFLKRLETIDDESTLSLLADRLFEVSTWAEFLSKH